MVAAQDTTEVNFSGRDRGRRGLGPAGNGKALGFFIHPVVAVDAEDEAVLVDAEIWTRDGTPKAARRQRRFEDKGSRRWLDGAAAAARLGAARQVIVVGDREFDIYPVFARRPDDVELITRVARNRSLVSGDLVFDAPLEARGALEVAVGAKPGHKARRARLRLSAGPVRLARPRNGAEGEDPDSLTLNLVETVEIAPPKGAKALHWRLYTTLAVDSTEAGHRCGRRQFDRAHRRHRQNPRRQHPAPEKPSPHRIVGLARLDHRPPRRMELLLQTTRTKDHRHRMETARRHARRLHHGTTTHAKRERTCVNPVA